MTSGTVTVVITGDSLQLSTTNTGNVYNIPNADIYSFSGTPSAFIDENGYSIRAVSGVLLDSELSVYAQLSKPVVSVTFGNLSNTFEVDATNTPLAGVLTDDMLSANMGVLLRNNDGSLYWYNSPSKLGNVYYQTFNPATVRVSTTYNGAVPISNSPFVSTPLTTSLQLNTTLKIYCDENEDGTPDLVFDFSHQAGFDNFVGGEIIYQIDLQTGTFEANIFTESTTGVYSLLRKSTPFTFANIATEFTPRDSTGEPLYFKFSGTTTFINDLVTKDAVFVAIDSSKIPFRILRNVGGTINAEAKNDIFHNTNRPAIEVYFNPTVFSTTSADLDLDGTSTSFLQGEYFYVNEVDNYITGFDTTGKYLLHYNLSYYVASGTSVGYVEVGAYANNSAFHIHKAPIYPDSTLSVAGLGSSEAGANLSGNIFIHDASQLQQVKFKNRVWSGAGTPTAILDRDNSEVFIYRII